MKYSELVKKFEMTSPGYDRCEFGLDNGCTVHVTRMSNGSHHCYLFSPKGLEIDTLGGGDKTDCMIFIEDAMKLDPKEWDNANWLHDLDGADLSYLD